MIIGISGVAGSGKDTVADLLVKDREFVKISLSEPMKRICKDVFGFTDEQLWGPSDFRNAVDERYPRSDSQGYKGFLTPRYALQKLGTEWGRDCYEDVWIDYALRQARGILKYGKNAGIVVPDIRYQNELRAIRKEGGEVWRIIRPGAGLRGEAGAHASENDIQEGDVDRIIMNDGNIADLYREIAMVKL